MDRPLPHTTYLHPTRRTWRMVVFLALVLGAGAAANVTAQTTTPTSTAATSATTSTSSAATATSSVVTATTSNPSTATPGAALSATEQTRVINLAANISNQLEATIQRLESITARLATRQERLEADDVDMIIPRARRTDVGTALALAQQELTTIDTDVYTVATSPNPRATWPQVKAKYQRAREHIVTARDALQTAITATRTAANQ